MRSAIAEKYFLLSSSLKGNFIFLSDFFLMSELSHVADGTEYFFKVVFSRTYRLFCFSTSQQRRQRVGEDDQSFVRCT